MDTDKVAYSDNRFGCYTQRVRMVKNVFSEQHITDTNLYGKLSKIPKKNKAKETSWALCQTEQ